MSASERLITSVQRHPILWAWALLLPFVVVPAIDLTVSGLFWNAAEGFFLGKEPLLEFIRKGLPALVVGSVIYVGLLAGAGHWLKQTFLGCTPRLFAYLATSLILGPGLIVNTLFKDNWGRARPSQIVEFGGQSQFTPPLMITDQCVNNCSFVSGHGAMGFWVTAFAFVAPIAWRRPAFAATLAFGLFVGWVRIAQGGHFLSDVYAAAILTIWVNWLLWKWIMKRGSWQPEG